MRDGRIASSQWTWCQRVKVPRCGEKISHAYLGVSRGMQNTKPPVTSRKADVWQLQTSLNWSYGLADCRERSHIFRQQRSSAGIQGFESKSGPSINQSCV